MPAKLIAIKQKDYIYPPAFKRDADCRAIISAAFLVVRIATLCFFLLLAMSMVLQFLENIEFRALRKRELLVLRGMLLIKRFNENEILS